MEQSVIHQTNLPRTRESIAADLRQLGLRAGMTVIVHSSLRSIGWVCGGAIAVVQALMDVITEEGTLVMPAHSAHYSDPATWENPPVPQSWWEIIRNHMPAFEPAITPTYGMGAIAEAFRTWPQVCRSSHPAGSFAAWGKDAAEIVTAHSLDNEFGEESPLARIYERDGWVLLLGVGYDANTSFHLAEYRCPHSKKTEAGAPVLEQGQRVWKTYATLDYRTEDFVQIGTEMERKCQIVTGHVGSAYSRLFRQRDAVDFAVSWLQQRATSG
ncbi:MAG: AAC(3) family N-acetyltransferase [Brevibacillus sp.]|nr:AAC(3) family N-acetyltransferase [Brevibacillus sp.]